MTYPGGKHGLSTPAMRKHVYTLIANYFDEMLKPQTLMRRLPMGCRASPMGAVVGAASAATSRSGRKRETNDRG